MKESNCSCHTTLIEKVSKALSLEKDFAANPSFEIPFRKINGFEQMILEIPIKATFITKNSTIRTKTVKMYGIYCPFCGRKRI